MNQRHKNSYCMLLQITSQCSSPKRIEWYQGPWTITCHVCEWAEGGVNQFKNILNYSTFRWWNWIPKFLLYSWLAVATYSLTIGRMLRILQCSNQVTVIFPTWSPPLWTLVSPWPPSPHLLSGSPRPQIQWDMPRWCEAQAATVPPRSWLLAWTCEELGNHWVTRCVQKS